MKLKTDHIRDKAIISESKVHIKSSSLPTFNLSGGYSEDACVYFLVDNNEVVYIGRTTDYKRTASHKKDKKFSQIYFIPTKRPYDISLEKSLLSLYKTKYNKNYFNLSSINKDDYCKTSYFIADIYNAMPNKEYTNSEIVDIFSSVWKFDNVQKHLANGILFKKVRRGIYIKKITKL